MDMVERLMLATANVALSPFYATGYIVGYIVAVAAMIWNAVAVGYGDGRGNNDIQDQAI
jgi:hypothetical protein